MKRIILILALLPFMAVSANAQSFMRGDANCDGNIDISDIVVIVNRVLEGNPASYRLCPDNKHWQARTQETLSAFRGWHTGRHLGGGHRFIAVGLSPRLCRQNIKAFSGSGGVIVLESMGGCNTPYS